MIFEDHADMPKQGNAKLRPYILFLTNTTVTFPGSNTNNNSTYHLLCTVLFIFKALYKYLLLVNLEKVWFKASFW